MTEIKHIVFDVSVIIDLWLGVRSAAISENLMDMAAEGNVRAWISASSIPILDYVARQALKRKGVSPEEARNTVKSLMKDLLETVGVLTNPGFDQKEMYPAARDIEDAQIAIAASQLNGVPVCVVSEDRRFDSLAKIPVKTPSETLTWLEETDKPTIMAFINLVAQQAIIRSDIEKRVFCVFHHGQYIMGPEINELEQQLATYTGVRHCITCSSGTDALLIALMAIDIGPGDEVITVPYTWISTAEVVALLRARPVFIDIEPTTFNLDPDKLEAAITRQTKAIIPVGIYGQCADMACINAIAAHHGIPVIEDAAQCFGATHHGKKACGLSLVGCTSFFPSKPLGCYGDGGAIFTDDNVLAGKMRLIRIHGQESKHQHPIIGINSRLDSIQAAILLEKLRIFPDECVHRTEVGQRYDKLLSSISGIITPIIASENTSVYAQYTILSEKRDSLGRYLQIQGIPAVAYYTRPLHLQGAFSKLGYKPGDFPTAERIGHQCLSLPMSPYLTAAAQELIAEKIRIVADVEN